MKSTTSTRNRRAESTETTGRIAAARRAAPTRLATDERGVSEVLGAILVFALVLSVLVIVQVAGVPAANQQIEFEHNARVQGDFQEFGQSVDRAAALGSGGSVAIESGVRYPPRLFLLNPGPAAGTVSTGGETAVTFSNVESINPETNDFFGGEIGYTTTSLGYGPSYNEYGSAPRTTYEHGTLYNTDRRDSSAVFARGNLISGNRISLTAIDGSLSESSTKSVSVNTEPISAPSQTVSITDGDGGPVTLTLSTGLTQEDWYDESTDSGILADQMVDNGGNVEEVVVDDAADTITITLKEDVTYDVRLAKVGVGNGYSDEPAAYVTTVADADTGVTTVGGTVTAEIRDRFNNPVSGETLYFYSPNGTFPDGDSAVSNERGRVAAKFVPGSEVKEATIFVGTSKTGDVVDTDDESQYVQYGVTVTDAEDTIQPGQINPADTGSLVLMEVTEDGSGQYTLRFENTAGSTQTVNRVRVPFFFHSAPGSGPRDDPPVTATLSNGSETVTLSVRGPYVTVPGNFTAGPNADLVLTAQFYEDSGATTAWTAANEDDFYVLSMFVSGTPQNYFVAPGETSGTTGSNPPTASIDAVTNSQRPNGNYDVTVEWSATDDVDLNGGTVNEVRLVDGDLDEPISPTGTTDSGSVTFSNINSDPATWTVELEVSDSDDQQVTATDAVP